MTYRLRRLEKLLGTHKCSRSLPVPEDLAVWGRMLRIFLQTASDGTPVYDEGWRVVGIGEVVALPPGRPVEG